MMLALLTATGIMSYYDSFYPDVNVMPRFNFDGEIESIDVLIDNMHGGLHGGLHCEEFIQNNVAEKFPDKRFEAQRRVAIKELTPGLYNEDGNSVRRNNRKDTR